jgi:hypothetical protein
MGVKEKSQAPSTKSQIKNKFPKGKNLNGGAVLKGSLGIWVIENRRLFGAWDLVLESELESIG